MRPDREEARLHECRCSFSLLQRTLRSPLDNAVLCASKSAIDLLVRIRKDRKKTGNAGIFAQMTMEERGRSWVADGFSPGFPACSFEVLSRRLYHADESMLWHRLPTASAVKQTVLNCGQNLIVHGLHVRRLPNNGSNSIA
jgi:hypothetical protein